MPRQRGHVPASWKSGRPVRIFDINLNPFSGLLARNSAHALPVLRSPSRESPDAYAEARTRLTALL